VIIAIDPDIIVGIVRCSIGVPAAGVGKTRIEIDVGAVRVRPAALNIAVGNTNI